MIPQTIRRRWTIIPEMQSGEITKLHSHELAMAYKGIIYPWNSELSESIIAFYWKQYIGDRFWDDKVKSSERINRLEKYYHEMEHYRTFDWVPDDKLPEIYKDCESEQDRTIAYTVYQVKKLHNFDFAVKKNLKIERK